MPAVIRRTVWDLMGLQGECIRTLQRQELHKYPGTRSDAYSRNCGNRSSVRAARRDSAASSAFPIYIERTAKANLIILELLTKYSNPYLTSRIYAVFNIVIRETTLDQSLINVTSSTASSPRQRPRTQINHLLLACYLLK